MNIIRKVNGTDRSPEGYPDMPISATTRLTGTRFGCGIGVGEPGGVSPTRRSKLTSNEAEVLMPGRFSVLLTAAALVLTAAVAAQNVPSPHTLTGQVTDMSGKALPGVSVELSRPGETSSVRNVVTNRDGRYRIDKVLPGVYVLVFRLPGFGSAIRDIEIGGGPATFEYDVQLSPASPQAFSRPETPQPSKRVVCGMTLITPPSGVDPGIHSRRTPPAGAEPVKPTMRAIQPTLCWEPSSDSPRVPPTR